MERETRKTMPDDKLNMVEFANNLLRGENPRAEVSGPSPVDSPEDEESTLDWPIIASYSRRDAIADGVLIDCSGFKWGCRLVTDIVGLKYPAAITAGAWAAITEGRESPTHDTLALAACLLDLSNVVRQQKAMGSSAGTDVHFTTAPVLVPHAGRVRLWSRCGPGDTAEPVITIMLEGED